MSDIGHIRYLRKTAVLLGFSVPENFRRYSSKTLLRCYNGVGAQWMPGWMRKIFTYICLHLEAAALIHDFEYTRKKKSYGHFTKANLRLAYNACRSRHPVLGAASALLCQLFGWYAYKNGKGASRQWNTLMRS